MSTQVEEKNVQLDVVAEPKVESKVVDEKTKRCFAFDSSKGCDKGDECKFSHAEKTKPRCSFFDGPKGCDKGNECKFSHDPSAEKKQSKKMMEKKLKEKKLRCSFFDGPNGCDKGDECTFSHDPLSEKKRCSYIDGPNGCWKGDDCEFSHKPLEDKPKTIYAKTVFVKSEDKPKTIYAKPGVLPIRKAPHLMERDKKLALEMKAKAEEKAKADEAKAKIELPVKKRCSYIDGPKGCWKGDDCEFDHSSLVPTLSPPPMKVFTEPLVKATVPLHVKMLVKEIFCLEDWLASIHSCVLDLAPILRENNIDSMKTLSLLTKDDCKDLGMTVGQRNLILDTIQKEMESDK